MLALSLVFQGTSLPGLTIFSVKALQDLIHQATAFSKTVSRVFGTFLDRHAKDSLLRSDVEAQRHAILEIVKEQLGHVPDTAFTKRPKGSRFYGSS